MTDKPIDLKKAWRNFLRRQNKRKKTENAKTEKHIENTKGRG